MSLTAVLVIGLSLAALVYVIHRLFGLTGPAELNRTRPLDHLTRHPRHQDLSP